MTYKPTPRRTDPFSHNYYRRRNLGLSLSGPFSHNRRRRHHGPSILAAAFTLGVIAFLVSLFL
jgi:hypothetical protein